MTDHRTLLAAYVHNHSETAFRELVERYVDLVYSSALRLVNGDAHLAEDVTQTVFSDLARLAGTLSKDVLLGGWLHRRTFHVATTMLRSERRRRLREKEAVEMSAFENAPETRFEEMAPLLDEAINQLNSRDRTAVILRFFERRDLRAIGAALGSSEDAAQKCISRAVDKLRASFARRGLVTSASAVGALLAANAVQAAPAGLSAAVSTSSLAGAGTLGGFSNVMQTLLAKKSALIAAGLAGAAVVAPLTVVWLGSEPAANDAFQRGLVLHYTFDADEVASRVTDASPAGNHGRAMGVQWTAAGRNGGAYEFRADGDRITVSNNPSINPAHLTLSIWVKTTTREPKWRRIFDKSWDQGFALTLAGASDGRSWAGEAALEIPGHFNTTGMVIADGTWHHVVATYDGVEQRLYVDGQLRSRVSWTGRIPATPFDLTIGCNQAGPEHELGQSYRGLLDEAMMWNRALSEEEVTRLHEFQSRSASQPSNNGTGAAAP